ncbi:DUF397 domain-containing protein [Actinomadura craniellae]|uniref:DUF397 domain-containing protein n=1 Tax=Actinomadura craniellae TaxID=2231787 RepID=A0A365H303_9ACTN|nr:DUF397 domain-containing protein [Actinomadura craniellae]RAY13484.1 DUF397 domain-containing protein [Actinomadura craniellae]
MTVWRKSSHSGGSSTHSDCIEVARLNGVIAFRDSKAPGTGHITIPAENFAVLVARLKSTRSNL